MPIEHPTACPRCKLAWGIVKVASEQAPAYGTPGKPARFKCEACYHHWVVAWQVTACATVNPYIH